MGNLYAEARAHRHLADMLAALERIYSKPVFVGRITFDYEGCHDNETLRAALAAVISDWFYDLRAEAIKRAEAAVDDARASLAEVVA